MTQLELENLIRTIVEKVLENLQPSLQSPQTPVAIKQPADRNMALPANLSFGNLQQSPANAQFSDKHLIAESDMMQFARNGIELLIVTNTTLLTPSARDYAREKNIKIQHGRENAALVQPGASTTRSANTIALLASRCSQSEKSAVIEAIQKPGFSFEEILVNRPTAANRQAALEKLTQQIAAGYFKFGIIIDEDAFSLSIQANKIENIRAVVCWDISSAELSQKQSQANLLCLNNRLLGFKSLAEITRRWLAASL